MVEEGGRGDGGTEGRGVAVSFTVCFPGVGPWRSLQGGIGEWVRIGGKGRLACCVADVRCALHNNSRV